MPVRLYFDEDAASRAVAYNLRARGVDVMTTSEAGREGTSDEEQLDFATGQGRVLCTCNIGDFFQLHTAYLAQEKNHSGMILIHQQRFSIGQQVLCLLRLLKTGSAEDMCNQIEFLSNW